SVCCDPTTQICCGTGPCCGQMQKCCPGTNACCPKTEECCVSTTVNPYTGKLTTYLACCAAGLFCTYGAPGNPNAPICKTCVQAGGEMCGTKCCQPGQCANQALSICCVSGQFVCNIQKFCCSQGSESCCDQGCCESLFEECVPPRGGGQRIC